MTSQEAIYCGPHVRYFCVHGRFGVKQRERLARAAGQQPHTLLMTATPIPRTLALVQYGSMDHSCITELPPGRTPITTHVVQGTEDARQQVGGGRST